MKSPKEIDTHTAMCGGRTVARKLSVGGLYVCARGAWHSNL